MCGLLVYRIEQQDFTPSAFTGSFLSTRNRFDYVFSLVDRLDQRTFLVARATTTPLMTREQNKHPMSAIVALYTGKSFAKITALEKLLQGSVNHWSPESILLFKLLDVRAFELGKVVGNDLEER